MPRKKWPPPGYPLVEGDYALTEEWTIHLPQQFARRIDDGDPVLWRPGMTIWLAVWNNDHHETQAERLARFKGEASPERFAERVSVGEGLTRFDYRLREENEDGSVESLQAVTYNDNGQLDMVVYFDDPANEVMARQLADSVAQRPQS